MAVGTEVQTEIVTVSPADAMKILESNKNNRRIRQIRVQTYARDMKAGKWAVGTSALLFGRNGELLDGQHRLLACVLANKSFRTVVIRGVSNKAHAMIDVGAARTLSDELKYRGETRTAQLASALNLVYAYDHDVSGMKDVSGASRSEVIRHLDQNPGLRDVVVLGEKVTKIGVMQSSYCAALYILWREHGVEKAEQFHAWLMDGTDYGDGDPCLALRAYALNAASTRLIRPDRVEWMAIVIKAINFWLLDQPVQKLRWRKIGSTRETFPRIVSSEDLNEE